MISIKQTIKSSRLLSRAAWPVYREALMYMSRHPRKGRIPALRGPLRLAPAKLHNYVEYLLWSKEHKGELESQRSEELALCPKEPRRFSIDGTCALCEAKTVFRSGFDFSSIERGRSIPNLRENLVCTQCGLRSRLRHSLHLFLQELNPSADQSIYITEQLGAAYRWLKGRGFCVAGSEYMPEKGDFGTSTRGIRNENLSSLTWPDDSFDFVLSFEVLEHVENVSLCLQQVLRCLKTGGTFLFTAPFNLELSGTLIRARRDEDGRLVHLLTPEYHGGNLLDPAQGSLCFRHFGWDILEQMQAIGFKETEVWLLWSRELGYMGGVQSIIVGRK
jgi:SAM-dependent methyltransferase